MFRKIDKTKLHYGKIDNIFEFFYELDENEIRESEKRKLKLIAYNKVRGVNSGGGIKINGKVVFNELYFYRVVKIYMKHEKLKKCF